jgi:hypothetical protein
MKIYLLAFSVIISSVIADNPISIPELDKFIEGTKLIGSIPEYLNKTKEAFKMFDNLSQSDTAESKEK